MGLLTTLVRPERRATIEGPLPLTAQRIVEWLTGEPTSAGVSISPQGSLKLAAVWACVNVLSQDTAALPLITYKRLRRGKDRAYTHPLYPILHDEPNPFMTSLHFRQTLQCHALLWGNAYANIERDEDGKPVALWPLRPDHMDTPVISEAGTLLYIYHVPGAGPRALTQSDVFHLRGLSSDGIMGYSPITLHRQALALSLATMEFGNRFFGNDSRPGGILQAKNKLSQEAADRMRKSWETAHQGLSKAHRVAVLEEGVEWKQVGIPPEDAQFLETRLFQVQETTRIFRMQPHKVQELSRATYSNIEEQNIDYLVDTLDYWLVNWEQQIHKDLLMPKEKLSMFAEHLRDARLRARTLERYQAYQLMLDRGVFCPNDVLERENMNTFEGGDVRLQQANMVPYGTKPEPKQEPAGVA